MVGAIALTVAMYASNADRWAPANDRTRAIQNLSADEALPVDSPEIDLPYPIQDSYNPFGTGGGLIDLQDPPNIESGAEYDPGSGNYYLYQNIGDIPFRNPSAMSEQEFLNYSFEDALQENWTEMVTEQNESEQEENSDFGVLAPSLKIESEVFDRIFGGNTIDIRPQGTAELSFGINRSKTDNPRIPERQRSITTFDFDQQIQLNLLGSIGDKMNLNFNYNTEASFDFENKIKLQYEGKEDEIIQLLEAGDVTMPLSGSLITGSQTLFGIKSKLRFGRLTATTIFSQERGQRKEINVSGGAQTQDFDIEVDDYEANRHYFLSHYFEERYNQSMRSLPVVNSQTYITRVEVWITNNRAAFEENRNIVAFSDLGEDASVLPPDPESDITPSDVPGGFFVPLDGPGVFPSNAQNNIYSVANSIPEVRGFTNVTGNLSAIGQVPSRHFEEVESARKLSPNEYTFNPQLGFISLNQSLNNDEVLAVAYQYTINGQTFQVGDFSTDGVDPPNALFLKMLKSTITNPRLPIWDLMMKNVYSIGAFQVNRENFRLDVWYNDPLEGYDVPFIPQEEVEGIPLIQLVGMDRIDQNTNPFPDGVFDYVDNAATQGGTINARNGRIFFSTTRPFGDFLYDKLLEEGVDANVAETISYVELYDSTQTAARQIPEKNRFSLKGTYQSASSDEISLNAINVPQGSVQVTAGGVQLIENVDYTVDYNLGRVKILNSGLLESQTPIKISLESNSLFSIQTKTLLGARFDYEMNNDLILGATVMNLTERPITQKINFGEEPISNTIWGLDANYQTESDFVTKLVDKLPFYGTKETSNLSMSGEFAHLIPGHSKAITKEGVSYIDDFEGSQSTIDLRNISQWRLASTPQLIPGASLVNDLSYGFRRAHLSWYVIDPLFFRDNNLTPDNITNEMQSDHRMREVLEREVFPNRELPPGTPTNIPTLDLTYYPNERGPYNFNADELYVEDGVVKLENPADNWAGIMRSLTTTDFEQSNIEFIQFWLMDPFNDDSDNTTGGDVYFNLGNISEDILRDSRKSFENGLPTGPDDLAASVDTTEWAIVPNTQAIVNAFDNTTDSNSEQDLGYDGMDDQTESVLRAAFVSSLPAEVQNAIQDDPANDNYRYFRGVDTDGLNIIERYKRFNQTEGNSITSADSPNDFPSQATTLPTNEDVNLDQNLSKSEGYFQYKVHLEPGMDIGGYITDKFETFASTQTGSRPVTWYQFKIPIQDLTVPGASRVGDIQDFRSIRFFRMFTTGWTEQVTLRFARLELIRGEWRRYTQDLGLPGEGPIGEVGNTLFNISAVNIEENGNRDPINYVLPPGIQREVNTATANLANLNEQSLALEVCNLSDGDARAAFRNVNVDMRSYRKLKMFIHAETDDEFQDLKYGDITVFVRLGSDFDQNFYEYEIPVYPTEWFAALDDEIWPERNDMEIEFEKLRDAKATRNSIGQAINIPYVVNDADRRITVVGNPVLSAVKTIMIGIRNPKSDENIWTTDLGFDKCAEVWVNELRLADFDQRGGWAAIARMNTQLADLGNLSVAGNYSTPGFGSIEKKVSERQRETIRGVDASSNIELGKFLPEESGVKVPMYVGFSETISDPQFDPLSPDLETSDIAPNSEDPKAYKRRRRTYTRRRSINFTNVRKERSKDAQGSPTPFDISNFTFSYSYNEFRSYDINTRFNNNKTYNGGLSYNYQPKPLKVEPFANIGFIKKSKWLKLLKEFNFNLGPRQFSFRTDVNRTYSEYQSRNNNQFFDFTPPAQYTKTFNWQRVYDLKYDITKSLKLNFTANNAAIIGEPIGRVDRDDRDEYEVFKDSVWTSIKNFGETTDYNHNFNVTYRLPLDKFPLTDWITVNTGYNGTYNWQRAPFSQDTLGNTIQNSRNMNVNGQINMTNLYNKVPFLKEANRNSSRSRGRNNRNQKEEDKKDEKGDKGDKDEKDKKKDKRDDGSFNILKETAKFLMMLKNISVTYNQTEGTLLPGYAQNTNVLGFDNQFQGPGAGFIVGFQDRDYPFEAARRGYLVENPYINRPYTTTYSANLNIRANIEPIKSFRIELTATSTESQNTNGFFRYNEDIADYVNDNPLETGSYSASIITWGSAFAQDDEQTNASEVFQTFLDNRRVISQRIAADNPFSTVTDNGYYSGYDSTSQDVVIPAFLAAYTDKDPSKVKLDPLSVIPMPNWRITYDGLSKNKKLKKIFRSVTLSHSYRSTYSVGTYTTNLFYEEIEGIPSATDQSGNYIPQLQVGSISISEQLSPLINIDMTWQNSLITRFEIRKNRTLSFTLSNYQLTENRSSELIIGAGYRFTDVKFPFKLGQAKNPTSDMNVRADLSIRDNITLTRSMNERTNLPTSGQRIFSLKTSADYTLNRNLTLRAFYDHQINDPKVSISFRTSNINAGIALRFTLAQ
ncbi:MAG: cell surface protein SprA [Flavobacteriales bacterium]|nr:cell surface protein SprA [Flavobacteriales bacterium]